MSNNNTYTIADLRKICKEQGYKFGCLYDSKEKKINNYNTLQVPISKHLDLIEARLKNAILPDGIYFVGLCTKYGSGQIVDKYAVIKGKHDINTPVVYNLNQNAPQENVLSYSSALQMQKEISSWETKYLFLEQQNVLLQKRIEELQAELKEVEGDLAEKANEGNLGEKVGGWLKEIAPMFAPIADRYFDTQDKKIALEEKKLDVKKTEKTPEVKQKKIAVGSPEFLDFIRKLHNEGEEEELNKCLDLLEQNFPEQYDEIGEELDLFEAEEEEEEEEEQQ